MDKNYTIMEKKIRLSEDAISIMRHIFIKNFLEDDELWLFGSRIDFDSRGGDIDLYIETNLTDSNILVEKKSDFYLN